ncbi:hypothetical protein [Micromonospora sp. NPDC007230]|uniref:hypothetical protein n=1 Tax=Micromonospora sp. NPDC007230 TaxID=3364237 RepID=UPI00369C559E
MRSAPAARIIRWRYLTAVLAAATAVVTAAPAQADGRRYVSAASVEALRGDLSTANPTVRTTYPGDPLLAADYVKPMGPLGHYGLIGPWGPLGVAGPVGNTVWDPSTWITGTCWDDWAGMLAWRKGPMSDWGPLGPDGPLSPHAYEEALPALGDFSKQLQAGGVWGVLGPVGPLGALGPLGPLGPTGAHGLGRTSDGAYVDSGGSVRRAVEVPYDSATRRYELYEFYRDEYARALGYGNDTSFMAERSYLAPGSSVEYRFTSASTQWVTINIVPMWMRYDLATLSGYVSSAAGNHLNYPTGAARGSALVDDFDLQLTDDTGRVLAASDSVELADAIQVQVAAGTRLTLRVSYYQRGSYVGYHDGYRLFVTGSTPYLAGTDITGAHQRPVGVV